MKGISLPFTACADEAFRVRKLPDDERSGIGELRDCEQGDPKRRETAIRVNATDAHLVMVSSSLQVESVRLSAADGYFRGWPPPMLSTPLWAQNTASSTSSQHPVPDLGLRL